MNDVIKCSEAEYANAKKIARSEAKSESDRLTATWPADWQQWAADCAAPELARVIEVEGVDNPFPAEHKRTKEGREGLYWKKLRHVASMIDAGPHRDAIEALLSAAGH